MSSVSGITIREKVSALEAATAFIGAEVEMANKYVVQDRSTGQPIFTALETTDCLTRQLAGCSPACAPWSVDIDTAQNGKALRMEKPCTLTCCCLNRPRVEIK